MTAVLAWEISTAASATWSVPTKLRYKSANDNTDDNNNPLVRPPSGTNFSFEKATRINVTTGPSSQVSNSRVLLSAAMATGITMYYGFTATYAQPIGTNSTIATTQLTTTPVTWANAGTKTDTGQWGDLLYTQIDIANTASGGELTDWNLINRRDEI